MAASRRTSQQITLLMLVLASITILTLDYHGEASRAIGHVRNGARDALAPFQRAAAAVVHPLGQAVAGAVHYGSLQQENRRLTDALGAANLEAAKARYEQSEAAAALRLAHLPFVGGIPTVPAEVISTSTSNFDDTIEIGAGTSSGVGPGMPVVADRGLIGTVTSASSSTATVQLVSANASDVPASALTGGNFEAKGNGSGEPLSIVADVGGGSLRPRQIVYTSSLALGAYPAGIPIAVVKSVRSGSGNLGQEVSATPIVDLDTLQYVTVVQWLPPA